MNNNYVGEYFHSLLSYGISVTTTLAVTATVSISLQLILVQAEIKNGLVEADIDSVMYQKNANAPSQAQQRQKEYEIAKKFCDTPPDPEKKDCSALSRKIDHAKKCVDLYEQWDNKWLAGRHAEKIQTWENRIDNLKEEHHKKCTTKN